MRFFAQTAANINDITASEIRDLGGDKIKLVPGGVQFQGDTELGYRVCMFSRTASRMLVELDPAVEGRAKVKVTDKDSLYDAAYAIGWDEHFTSDMTFAVTLTATRAKWLNNTQFGALRVKDAIVDYMRHKHQTRPDVDAKNPDVTFHVHISGTQAIFYLDFSGQGLHKRGYRIHTNEAMLKEHLAASLLHRSGFKTFHEELPTLLDPFCGMGTIPIEAALVATNTAPGLITDGRFGFLKWLGHIPAVWDAVKAEAEAQRRPANARILAWDIDPKAIEYAKEHAERAGVAEVIDFEVKDFTRLKETLPAGIIVTDPPYGIRMGTLKEVTLLYHQMGKILPDHFPGWKVNILCGEPEMLEEIRLRPSSTNAIYNGSIQCVFARYDIFDAEKRRELEEKAEERKRARLEAPLGERAEMCMNRIKKNKRMIKNFLKKNEVTSYRIYDADIPEFAAAVDIYENRWAHIQEYAPPKTIDPRKAEDNFSQLIDAVQRATEIPYENIYTKQRKKQKGSEQYTKLNTKGQMYIMREHGLKFLVNFTDYLDTGIFLDHRPIRGKIQELAKGGRFLNLFAYTGTATVHAAAGGALSTVTVDASQTYLKWAEENMALNGFTTMNHIYYKDDCIHWLKANKDKFDLIFLDPPTFSNSKSRKDAFDIQKDHRGLIMLVMKHLTPNGTLIFSNNFRRFYMDPKLKEQYLVEEITDESIPDDFKRNLKIHRCWTFRPKRVVTKPTAPKAKPAKKIVLKKPIE